jgi:eukaryotic-like serine/threonine-protein kinase
MASLAHAISEFQSGGLSQDDFIAQLDSTLTRDSVGSARLLEILGEAHTRMPLPPEIFAEVQRRIEQMAATNLPDGGQTRVQTIPSYPPTDPFGSTRLAASAAPEGSSTSSSRSSASSASGGWAGLPGVNLPLPGSDQVKGIGDTLNNRFVLEECLGVGGMGTVYKALDLRKLEASDRKPYVAIKVLNLQFRGNPQSLIALQREAKKAQVLAHRNIVAVYDFDRDGAVVYLTMEYLSGKPLSYMLRSKDFKGKPYAGALPLIKGMASALAYAHEHGFVHCDFKPGNVFVTDKGEVKVIDFGIARVFQRPEEESDATVFDPGTLGALTPAYASPEMLEHREPDPRDDVYALGCIVYELLTGRHPFNRLSATQARSAGLKPQRPEGLGGRAWRALRAALAFDRAARMPNVTRFVDEFAAQPHFTRERLLIAGGATLAGLGVLGVGILWYRLPGGTNNVPHAASAPMAAEGQGSASPASVGSAPGTVAGTAQPPASQASTAPAAPASPTLAGPIAAAPTAAAPTAASPSAAAPTVASPPAAAPTAAAPTVASPSAAAPTGASPTPASATAAAPTLATVGPLLAPIPCSALAASVQGRTVQVRGFVRQSDGVATVKDRLSVLPGVRSLSLDLTPLAADKCDVIQFYAPFWTRNWQTGHTAGLRVQAAGGQLVEGDPLVVSVTTPGYDSYVNIDYYQLDGTVVHMVPSPHAPDNQAPPNYAATVGSAREWVIAKPFGTELVVLLSTPAPLFDAPRPESEPRAEYLRLLNARLAQMSGKYGANRILADVAEINSQARKH